MDHGILNLSLSKRGLGSIDAQVDRWKAEEAKAAREARRTAAAARKAAKVEAVALLAALTDERLNALAAHCKQTPAAVLKHLRSQCNWNPAFVLRLLANKA